MTYASGSRYDGQWRDGRPNGHGVMVSAAGLHTEGEYRNGELIYGVSTLPNGSRFEGQYRNGTMNGHGIMTSPNGARFEGEYRNGEQNGYGVMIFSSGMRCAGNYHNLLQLNGYCTNRDGTRGPPLNDPE